MFRFMEVREVHLDINRLSGFVLYMLDYRAHVRVFGLTSVGVIKRNTTHSFCVPILLGLYKW